MGKKPRCNIDTAFIHGSTELGTFTGFTDKRIHKLWREKGLPFGTKTNGAYFYKKDDVVKFLEKFYHINNSINHG